MDECDTVCQRTGGHIGKCEPKIAIGPFVELLENERIFETYPPGGSGMDEALIADKKDSHFVYTLSYDTINFATSRRDDVKPR